MSFSKLLFGHECRTRQTPELREFSFFLKKFFFLAKFLSQIFSLSRSDFFRFAFKKLSESPKFSLLREGIKVFLRTFLTPNTAEKDVKNRKMIELIELVELALDGQDYVPL